MIRTTFDWIIQRLACFTVGFLLALLYLYITQSAADSCTSRYPLTDKQVGCADYDESASTLKNLEKEFDDAAAAYVKEGKVTRVSVWVRDLATRQYAATNENEKYAPASLFKVPVMIAYYKIAEIEPTILELKLPFTGPDPDANNSEEHFKPEQTLQPGQSYTIDELIDRMIMYSDNDAMAILVKNINPDIYEQALIDLGIKIPRNMGGSVSLVTPKSYSAMYRMLYNASYLDREHSQKALDLLTKTTFKGIADPLPKNALVAHKFAEREFETQSGTTTLEQLHDCGIVYKDNRPYSICIMTEGHDFDKLIGVVKDLSLLTFDNL